MNGKRIASWQQGFARNKWQCDPRYASLWDGLAGAWAPALGATGATVRDLAGVYPLTASGGSWATGSEGPTYYLGAATNQLNSASTDGLAFVGDVAFTLAVDVWITGTSGSFPGVLAFRTTLTQGLWELYWTGATWSYAWRDGVGLRSVALSATSMTGLHRLVLTRQVGGQYRWYVNGILSASPSSALTPLSGSHILCVGSLYSGSAENVLGYYSQALISRRAWTANEVALWSADPLGMFRPKDSVLYVPAGVTDYPVSLALALTHAAAASALGAGADGATLGSSLGASAGGAGAGVSGVALDEALGVVGVGIGAAGGGASLGRELGVIGAGAAGAGGAASLGRELGVAETAAGAAAATFSLGRLGSITLLGQLAADAAIAVNLNLGAVAAGQAGGMPSLAVARSHALSLAAQALDAAGISLAAVLGVTVRGTELSLRIAVPVDRMYEVAAVLRAFILEEHTRARLVTMEDRTYDAVKAEDVWW